MWKSKVKNPLQARCKHLNKFSSRDRTKKTTKKNRNPRWHVSLLFSGSDICYSGVKRLVNRGFGYSWTYSPHLCPECTGLAFQTLSPVTRETPAALESTTPPPPSPSSPPSPPHHHHPPPSHSRDITPVLGSRAWKEKTKISPVGGCSRWPADVHIVFWLQIDLRAVKSSWSCKARSCLFIYPSICVRHNWTQ